MLSKYHGKIPGSRERFHIVETGPRVGKPSLVPSVGQLSQPTGAGPGDVEPTGTIIQAVDHSVDQWTPKLWCPSGCRRYEPHDKTGHSMTAHAFVYAAHEVKHLHPVRLFFVTKRYAGSFRLLDEVLVARRCHPTDFMRAQFTAWPGGFHDKKRGRWVDCDYIPPPFMCPQHATVQSLESAEGWQRAWARYEVYSQERTPFGPLYRDPNALLDLSIKMATLRAVHMRKTKKPTPPSIPVFRAAAQQHRQTFVSVRKGELSLQDMVQSVDERTLALLVYCDVVPENGSNSSVFIDALAFLRSNKPSIASCRRILHPLKINEKS